MNDETEMSPSPVLWLAPDERQWLAQTLPATSSREMGEVLAGGGVDPRIIAARRFRATLLAVFLDGSSEDVPLRLSPDELWLLDMHLMEYDLRDAKLPSGRLLSEFARKVWELITEAHRDDLPPLLRKEPDHAPEDADTDESANAVAEAEALLRTSEDSGTG
jgi:hypothetical protein